MKAVVSQQPAVGNQQTVAADSYPVKMNFVSALPNTKRKSMLSLINKCCLLFLSLVSFTGMVNAQPDSNSAIKSSPVEMATGLRSNGKIYVVVAVLVIILAGLISYLIRLDRKITRLEKGTWKDS